MDALLMIKPGSQATDRNVPAKEPQQHEPKFGKVLNKKRQEQQPERTVAEKHSSVAKSSKAQQTVASQKSTEGKRTPVDSEEVKTDTATVVEEGTQIEVVTDMFSGQVDSDLDDDSATAGEVLLEEPVVSLPEHHLDNVDVEELVVSPPEHPVDDVDGEEPVVSLPEHHLDNVDVEELVVSQPEHHLDNVVIPQATAEQAVNSAIELQQPEPVSGQIPVEGEPARQQRTESIVATTASEVEVVLSEEQIVANVAAGDVDVPMDAPVEVIDPRFAGLLKPRIEKQPVQHSQPIREAAPLHGSSEEDLPLHEVATAVLTEEVQQKQGVELDLLAGLSAKQVLEQLGQVSPHHLQSPGQGQVQGFDAVKTMPQTPMVQLSNGYQIPEGQIFDQVVTQLSGSLNGDTGRMVLRLQPAELGSLRLELKIEGDRVQAHLHAQTHQVQEVLERNLPQLRSALAEQGLKIDQFQVNVDQQQSGGQFENLAQQQQHNGTEKQPGWYQQNREAEEPMIPLAHVMQNGGGGISLHV